MLKTFLLLAIFFTTPETLMMKDPVCCYIITELIGVMERTDCAKLMEKNADVSMSRLNMDKTCPEL